MTTLESQVEYLTSRIKLALRSLSTSSLTNLRLSSPIFLFSYDTNLAWRQMASLWHIMLGWIPDMSDVCHANRFVFLCKVSTMCLCSWLVRCRLSCVYYPGVGLRYSLKSSSIGFGPLLAVSSCGSTSNTSSKLAWLIVRARIGDPSFTLMT